MRSSSPVMISTVEKRPAPHTGAGPPPRRRVRRTHASATDDLLRLGVLKMAKQDPRKFKKKLDAGDFGSLPPGLIDSVQLEKGGTDDESTMISDIVQRTRPAEDHEYTFDLAIVDEAHLLKNDGALWGIGAALICLLYTSPSPRD